MRIQIKNSLQNTLYDSLSILVDLMCGDRKLATQISEGHYQSEMLLIIMFQKQDQFDIE